jgi:hypothetical protein
MSDLEKTETRSKVAESSSGDVQLYVDEAAEKSYGQLLHILLTFTNLLIHTQSANSTSSSYPSSP